MKTSETSKKMLWTFKKRFSRAILKRSFAPFAQVPGVEKSYLIMYK